VEYHLDERKTKIILMLGLLIVGSFYMFSTAKFNFALGLNIFIYDYLLMVSLVSVQLWGFTHASHYLA
jgi:hypothetical protein